MRHKTLSAIVSGAALAGALTLPSASAANAAQTYGRWNVPSYAFGSTAATVTFTLTNTTTTGWIDYPIKPTDPNIWHWVEDTCTHAIAPGGHCFAVIAYTPQPNQQPWSDTLGVAMTDLAGNAVPTPVVQLTGGGIR